MKVQCAILAVALAAIGCATGETLEGDSGPTYVGVDGVWIQQVAIYQSLKRVLAEGGVPAVSNVPLVAGRDAVVRVFYAAAPEKIGTVVRGRLEITGHESLIVEGALVGQSFDHDMASTFNFGVPGDAISEPFEYRVSLLHEAEDDNVTAHHPAAGRESHFVEGPRNTLRVILAPFQYNADGSGRLPDTSPAMVELYRQRLLALYPVSNVEVTVREPYPWSQPIGNWGEGWDSVQWALYSFRDQDGTSADVYYYGIFNPADTFEQYCQGGCILGLTWMYEGPPDVGTPDMRMALGIGYPEVAPDTTAHELGHVHGRHHAPCGPGMDPNSIDPAFPYANGGIGVWGLDTVTLELKDPTKEPSAYGLDPGPSDMMAYCSNEWVSDYTYAGLLFRGKNVNLPDIQGANGRPIQRPQPARVDHELILIDGQGRGDWKRSVKRQAVGPAGSIPVSLRTLDGQTIQARGHYYRYDHLPGGWLFFPKPAVSVNRAELSVDGRPVAVERR